ncbi:MAG: hypothetical protein Q9195_008913 [Heterodermia aff. obscurata]
MVSVPCKLLPNALIISCTHYFRPNWPSVDHRPLYPQQNMSTRKSGPSRVAATPDPSVSTKGMYCHTCGRIIIPRKSHAKSINTSTPPKYCSDRCRREKPPVKFHGVEAEIERMFVELLGSGEQGAGRKVVGCEEVEARVFGTVARASSLNPSRDDREFGGEGESDPAFSDQTSDDDDGGGVSLGEHLAPAEPFKKQPLVVENSTPQQRGRQRAANREKVRQAARRGTIFGFPVHALEHMDASLPSQQPKDTNSDTPRRRKVEAVQGGRIVEASFAKGPWGVRWKDEHG